MGKGILICLDGCDCSFKETNVKALYNKMLEKGFKVKKLSFPDYSSDSSIFVKMYLSGKFGANPNDINPYTASTFYALDRYSSYHTKWKEYYENGYIIITDRYVTANALHQASKIENRQEKIKFLDWLWDLEYVKNGIPTPDLVIFLDMPFEIGAIINKNRKNKITGENKKDIHESNLDYLKKSYENALWVAEKYKWHRISCINSKNYNSVLNGIPDNVKTKEQMLNEIYSAVLIKLNLQEL